MNTRDRQPRFLDYQIVKVVAPGPKKRAVFGEEGVVLAATETEQGGWYYTVFLAADSCCWCFEENEIESTGRFADPAEFARSESIRVRVDESGRGSIVE